MTTDYEIRMLVCWLLHKIKSPVTMTQLNYALQLDGLVNYFELTRAVNQLMTSGHLLELPAGDENLEHPMTITELGLKTALTFERSIPLTVREKSLASLQQSLLRERLEKENKVAIEPTEDGYRLTLTITDVSADLLTVSMYVPAAEMCETMKKRFLSDPTVLYRAVLTAL
ncbi:MAG: DUF4364 family protein, partial [Oscillospiraceae bacterium]